MCSIKRDTSWLDLKLLSSATVQKPKVSLFKNDRKNNWNRTKEFLLFNWDKSNPENTILTNNLSFGSYIYWDYEYQSWKKLKNEPKVSDQKFDFFHFLRNLTMENPYLKEFPMKRHSISEIEVYKF